MGRLRPLAVAVGLGLTTAAVGFFPGGDVPAHARAVPAPGGGTVYRLLQPESDPAEARQAAEEILAAAEFQIPEKTLAEKAIEWIQEQIVRLLNNLFSGGGGAAATWLIVAAVAAVLVMLVRRLVRNVQPDPGVRMATAVATRRSAEEWRADAVAHEAAGAWKDALRCRFRALVGDLIDRGALGDVPGRTAGEYRAELRERAPAAGDDFAAAAELFELAWYADAETGPAENAAFRSAADRVLQQVGR